MRRKKYETLIKTETVTAVQKEERPGETCGRERRERLERETSGNQD